MAHIFNRAALLTLCATLVLTSGCEKPRKNDRNDRDDQAEQQQDRWTNRTMPDSNNRKPEEDRNKEFDRDRYQDRDDRDYQGRDRDFDRDAYRDRDDRDYRGRNQEFDEMRWDHRDARDSADRWGSNNNDNDNGDQDPSPWGSAWDSDNGDDDDQPSENLWDRQSRDRQSQDRQSWDRKDRPAPLRGRTQQWVQRPTYRRYNVVHIVDGERELATFAHAIKVSGIDDALSGKGPFTIFAPTDEAFDDLPTGKLSNLLKPENRDELIKVLKYHVVAGEFPSDELDKVRSLRTLEGQSLSIRVRSGRIYVDDAEVEGVDASGANGVVHVISKVLMPH